MQRITTPIILAGLLLAPMVLADENSDKSENNEIVVTATRTAQTVDDSLASVTVITRKDIESSGAASLPELLTGLVGMDSAINGGLGKNSSLFLRGTNSDHTLVLIDGIKIGSATLGGASLQYIPLDQIERIEVVRGPRSSLYGSEAIGGIIQIFTRGNKGPAGLQAELAAGNYSTEEASAGFVGGTGATRYQIRVRHFDTEGINAQSGNNPDLDGYRNTSITAGIDHRLSGSTQMQVRAFSAVGRNYYDSYTTTSDYYNDFVQQTLGWQFDQTLGPNWQSHLLLGLARDQSNNYKDGVANGDFITDRSNANWQNDFTLSSKTMLTIGADLQQDRVTSTSTSYTVTARDNLGAFTQFQAGGKRHRLNASARIDQNSQYGRQQTGNIGWGYRTRGGLQLTASLGTGFKAPTFNDLYWPAVGNPSLEPESSVSGELAVGQNGGESRWDIRLYQNQIDNLIAWVETSPFFWQPVNINRARILGIEGRLHKSIGAWQTVVGIALTDPRDLDSGTLLPRRSQQNLKLSANRKIGKTQVAVTAQLFGNRYDDADNTTLLAPYALVGLKFVQPLNKQWQLHTSIHNLLDAQYQTASNYASLGRFLMLRLVWRSEKT